MTRVNFVALAAVVVVAFIASSLWYSPVVLGNQFLAFSGFAAPPAPSAFKVICELLRTFVLGYVIAHLILQLRIQDWRGALKFGLWLWLGFPFVLLTGSILWQNVPWQLAAIHSGDWLIKLTLIPVTMAIWPGPSFIAERVGNLKPKLAGCRAVPQSV